MWSQGIRRSKTGEQRLENKFIHLNIDELENKFRELNESIKKLEQQLLDTMIWKK